jgi:hypothetical protein
MEMALRIEDATNEQEISSDEHTSSQQILQAVANAHCREQLHQEGAHLGRNARIEVVHAQ